MTLVSAAQCFCAAEAFHSTAVQHWHRRTLFDFALFIETTVNRAGAAVCLS